ncbi:biotin--[acetyl-CoA-carboxylase] ligase [Aquihabitans sp. G128]|uniref:biotin--[acetyl-CoA-carboxylase] ligase n=1 Tax=Aquihabitans sp. G128 TaxID=2849779 RepID=UPI001C229D26|nr:biotin--[acetyl-CoA-carboxylase] ligase [Aquihabitans sp. G128]QXC61422.1 biotin--[acetyl-CoA-carboxylase] ligase [Aquihabitans sp. G128]
MDDTSRSARVAASLAGTRFADVRWEAETGSTNADVMELARAGEPEGIVVVADHQTAGRGRRGRTWEAPSGASLMASVLLRPRSGEAGATTMAVAVAAAEAVEELTGRSPRLKWPNDLVWPGDGSGTDRKLAGILAEVDWPTGSHVAGGWSPPGPADRLVVVVGIGINVAWGPMPADLAPIAVALDHIVAPDAPPAREDLLVAFLRALDRTYRHLTSGPGGRDLVMARWRDRSATLGRRVRVDLGADDVEGTAVDVTAEGHLVVETIEGERRVLAVGDVVHLRAT